MKLPYPYPQVDENQWLAITRVTASSLGGKVLMCGTGQFLWCEYSHRGPCQVTALDADLGRDAVSSRPSTGPTRQC